MRWNEIKRQYPTDFILLDDIEEEKVDDNKYRVLGGTVVEISKDIKQIMRLYNELKQQGRNVLYTLPSTPDDFIIEDVPFMGILR